MALFSTILGLFSRGAVSNADTGAQHDAPSSRATNAGISVSDENALNTSAVWACVQVIANSVASLPLKFYDKTPEGREEITRRDPLTDLFNISPNAMMKPRDFRMAMTVQVAISNNAYAFIKWSGDRPVAVMPLRLGRMVPHIDDNGELTYHYHTSEGVVVYAKKSILHLKGFGADGVVGFNRTSYAKETLGIAVSADVYAAKQFANGGNSAGGYMSFDDFLTKDQRANAHKLYEGMGETSYNANKLWILEGGVKYTPNTLPPDTMQMLQTRQMQVSEIARYFGVPEVLIGGGSGSASWPASFEQQILYFLTYTLQPYLDEWECAILDALVPANDRQKIAVDHDVSQFIRADSKTQAEVLSTLGQNGYITSNEAREKLQLSQRRGGDELRVQVNMTPLTTLGDADNEKDN